MIIPIRPSRLFAAVQEEGAERVVQVRIPKRRNMNGPDGTPTLLETMVLLAAAKIVKAKTIFEFGTCLGSTTLNLALNLPAGRVYTLDLDRASQLEAEQNPVDKANTEFRLSKPWMEWERHPFGVDGIIKPLLGDSTKWDDFPKVDMVWIDGGHDLRTVSSDTSNAMLMNPRCIAWHDYHNMESWEVSQAVDAFASTPYVNNGSAVYHIEDTTICLWFNPPIQL